MVVRRPFIFLVGLVLAVLIGAYFANQDIRVIFFRVIVLLTAVGLVAVIWTLLSLRGIQVQRFSRINRQQVGQVFEERFEIQNSSRISHLWLEIDDLSEIRGKRGSKVLTNIFGRQRRSYFSRTLLTQRGSFALGPTVIGSGDPFGFFSKSREIPAEKSLIVLPYMVRLNHFPGPAGKLPGGRALRKKSLEVTPYAAGVREYNPGDPLSRIHWRTTARKDRLMVKEFEQDPHADVWIMLDSYKGVHVSIPEERQLAVEEPFWGLPQKVEQMLAPDTFEYAVSAAASIAGYYIGQGKSVGFASAGKFLNVIPAERSERQLAKILETLAFVRPVGDLPILGLIEGQAKQITRGSTVVLVTALNSDMLLLAVDVLLRRDLRPVVVLVDPGSFVTSIDIDPLVNQVRQYSEPVTVLRKGDDLQQALESEAAWELWRNPLR